MQNRYRAVILGVLLTSVTLVSLIDTARAQVEKRDMELVGYHDLQARTAYQPLVVEQSGRWIAYIGHHGGVQVNPLTQTGTVIYRSKMHLGLKRNFQVMPGAQWLELLLRHVPDRLRAPRSLRRLVFQPRAW